MVLRIPCHRLAIFFVVQTLLALYAHGSWLPCWTSETASAIRSTDWLPLDGGEGAVTEPSQALSFDRRGVYSPRITNPTHGMVWRVDSDVSVVWDLSDMPPVRDITNINGTLILGHLSKAGSNEHLDLKHPLARHFDIRRGNITFKVPKVKSRKDYIVVLFGDSGNRSPVFSIID